MTHSTQTLSEVPAPPRKTLLCWALSPLYITLFFGILLVFHPILIVARWISFRAFTWALNTMCWCILQNLKITVGTQFSYRSIRELPRDRPLLVLSNHQSMYDIPMLMVALHGHSNRFVSKRELAKWIPAISFAVRRNRSALIDRGDRAQAIEAIRQAARSSAADNAALCMFPEGTRARDGVMKRFKTAGFVASLENMPNALIVPVAISRSWELLHYNLLPIPSKVRVTLQMLDPIEPAGKDPYELLETIEQQIKIAVQRCQGQDA